VDEVVRVHLECCPHCGDKLEKSETVTTHTVEDIAPLEKVKTQVVVGGNGLSPDMTSY